MFVELFPEVCLGCACQLSRVVDVAACRYQQLELRNHRPRLTEWRRHEVDCERCGTWTRADYDSCGKPGKSAQGVGGQGRITGIRSPPRPR